MPLQGVARAREAGFLAVTPGAWHLDISEYEHYEQVGAGRERGRWGAGGKKWAGPRHQAWWQQHPEHTNRMAARHSTRPPLPDAPQVEHGDLNWIVPGKLLAFSGPAISPDEYIGFRAMTPEDYWTYYKARRVAAVVRLNKKVGSWRGVAWGVCVGGGGLVAGPGVGAQVRGRAALFAKHCAPCPLPGSHSPSPPPHPTQIYDRQRFLGGGFKHHELYFPGERRAPALAREPGASPGGFGGEGGRRGYASGRDAGRP